MIAFAFLFVLRKWLKGIECPIVTDMTGKIVVITGANRGIGR